jgi:poly-gamma-glutamate biosynthesis protein PgsC/CapC
MAFETLFIGLVAALLYVEIIGIYPGGIIVPGYIALYLDQPPRVAVTLACALLSLFTYKILSRFFILFGRRRFVVMVLLGGIWAQLWFLLNPQFFPAPMELRVIGWVVPGLLANNLERQKFLPTLASLITVSIITYFLVKVISLL